LNLDAVKQLNEIKVEFYRVIGSELKVASGRNFEPRDSISSPIPEKALKGKCLTTRPG
jgi:hypothetical protein